MTSLSELTTLRLGGPADRLLECRDEAALVDAVRQADQSGEPVLLVGGGSNLVVADEGFPGTVARILTSGIEERADAAHVLLRVAAGEPWDALVARCVEAGLAGVECLSGIPGLVGATPIQNVGAYGQEVCETIVLVEAYDRERETIVELSGADCGFSYRSSVFKRLPDRWVVLAVTFRLERRTTAQPVRYGELTRVLGIELGETAALCAVRAAVLGLRRRKGMVLDRSDPDTHSAGSFFLNPILEREELTWLRRRAADLGADGGPPEFAQPDGRVKTSAAWLIERAGFHKGYGNPSGIAISSKHTLALTNRGKGTTGELMALAEEIAGGVEQAFGVVLHPEPTLVGCAWPSLTVRA